MRKPNTVLIVCGVILMFGAFSAWRQYHWASEAMRIASANGWTRISSSDNYSDPVQPWTLFRQPVNMMVFTKPEEIRLLPDNIVAAPTLWMHNRRLVDNGEDHQTWYVASCTRGEIAAVDSSTVDQKDLVWRKTTIGTPGQDLMESLCNTFRQ
jgi:hypothetical protein